MKKITVNDKVFKLKFGYYSVCASGIMEDVLSTAGEMENIDETDGKAVYAAIGKLMPLIGRVVLAGMQRYHSEEYGVDYEDESDVKVKLKKVYALLDDYFDPEDGEPEESAIELFWDFVNELKDSGFLSGKPQTEQEVKMAAIEQIPQDHKKAAK